MIKPTPTMLEGALLSISNLKLEPLSAFLTLFGSQPLRLGIVPVAWSSALIWFASQRSGGPGSAGDRLAQKAPITNSNMAEIRPLLARAGNLKTGFSDWLQEVSQETVIREAALPMPTPPNANDSTFPSNRLGI